MLEDALRAIGEGAAADAADSTGNDVGLGEDIDNDTSITGTDKSCSSKRKDDTLVH